MIRKIICFNSLIVLALAVGFFIYPPVRAWLDIRDPALRQPGMPRVAWRLYHSLTPRYAAWARERVAAGRAAEVDRDDISGTEWPLFGSAFYLWSLENLQAAWDAGDHSGGAEPRVYAREAIQATAELVVDPRHATWVKKHWGENYLHRENVFYRMLVIAALTSREKLLHDGFRQDLLRDQVETFAAELDASPTGLLDDYPAQCYPGDVMAALMCIRRADAVLGTDHSQFIQRALRGFTGPQATPEGLPPYAANAKTGRPESAARGCGNSYMGLTAPELWPAQAQSWFEQYDKLFWQHRISAVGYREYPVALAAPDWTMDVDAGPVIAGHGVSASAFGLGAARKNGRFDRAYPLAAELLITVGELPNGVLAGPRLLSNVSDAPLLGEAAVLWQLSVPPEKNFPIKTGDRLPAYVYVVTAIWLLPGLILIWWALRSVRRIRRAPEVTVWFPRFQLGLWSGLLLAAVIAYFLGHLLLGIALLIFGVMFPATSRNTASAQGDRYLET
ncbi:MAG TPA: hypothetical protein VL527_08410 [Dongiaceae bacterium]|jgi:hypothetical protein|nr:hypothetical protein [Dongiaceae bacterium]